MLGLEETSLYCHLYVFRIELTCPGTAFTNNKVIAAKKCLPALDTVICRYIKGARLRFMSNRWVILSTYLKNIK